MGIDWDSLWTNVKTEANKAVEQGWPVLQSGLEQWGISVLQEQNAKTQAKVDETVNQMLAKPPEPGSIQAAISNTLSTAVAKDQGLMLVGVLAVAMVAGFFLLRKG